MKVVCELDPEKPHFRGCSKSEEVRLIVHNYIPILRCFLGQRHGLPSESDEENEASREGQRSYLNIIPGAQPAHNGTTNTPSDDEGDTDDFIIDDEDGSQHIDLPINFSSAGVQPLASSFKVVFQLFVHVSCLEPHLREEGMKRLVGWSSQTVTVRKGVTKDSVENTEHSNYFQNGLHQLRRKLTSTRDSFASSLWNQEFKRQLEIFPECEVMTVEPKPYCDACRRGAAVSTRQMRLLGNRYDKGYEVRVVELARSLDLMTFPFTLASRRGFQLEF